MSDGRGLLLRITPTGGKLWRWKYRTAEGVQKEMSFGPNPDVSLADARERHAAARKLLASGIDPMAQRKAERVKSATSEANSFKARRQPLLSHWRVGKSERHADTASRRLEAKRVPPTRRPPHR